MNSVEKKQTIKNIVRLVKVRKALIESMQKNSGYKEKVDNVRKKYDA
tara:strand:+ start:357 stop:497 length:141 start_codon:yes stop_codon:yes gene_type:complete